MDALVLCAGLCVVGDGPTDRDGAWIALPLPSVFLGAAFSACTLSLHIEVSACTL